ncbi:hypothetical protein SERLA73DRAFT_65520 [Serpula lacrymans var. lacrymans S7.3]|uniref:protein-tyrosine-phosphatase n=1 Tax=Serpula lacrymans var. lacrymans (strain S7.3) TaxID=936435 RepID=F8QGN1_SERL3|nr:hypothetical protein SERLA73DRAFT_65520 [Serpula lacrymans var. lacrymans S7.3]
MTWSDVPISVDEIVDGKIYIGNLSAALSLEWRSKLGISHVLSVCPEYSSTGPKHLTICVQDSEYEDLLIHLPQACQFIQSALDEGGKILVHCVMGVSRSTTVVCAYCELNDNCFNVHSVVLRITVYAIYFRLQVMATRRCCAPAAIQFIRKRRI